MLYEFTLKLYFILVIGRPIAHVALRALYSSRPGARLHACRVNCVHYIHLGNGVDGTDGVQGAHMLSTNYLSCIRHPVTNNWIPHVRVEVHICLNFYTIGVLMVSSSKTRALACILRTLAFPLLATFFVLLVYLLLLMVGLLSDLIHEYTTSDSCSTVSECRNCFECPISESKVLCCSAPGGEPSVCPASVESKSVHDYYKSTDESMKAQFFPVLFYCLSSGILGFALDFCFDRLIAHESIESTALLPVHTTAGSTSQSYLSAP